MGSVYIVVLLTDKHNLWGRLRERQDTSRKVAGYENPRAGHAPPLRVPIYIIKPATAPKQQGGVETPPYEQSDDKRLLAKHPFPAGL